MGQISFLEIQQVQKFFFFDGQKPKDKKILKP